MPLMVREMRVLRSSLAAVQKVGELSLHYPTNISKRSILINYEAWKWHGRNGRGREITVP